LLLFAAALLFAVRFVHADTMQLHAQFRTAREVCERRGRAPPASAALPPVESEGCANSARSRTGASLLRCKELVARKFAARKEAGSRKSGASI
jgi:hypothetical protein